MQNMLDADELREMADYISHISDLPDNTNGEELTKYAARICREINKGSEDDGNGKTEKTSRAASAANVGRSSRSHGRKLRGTVT